MYTLGRQALCTGSYGTKGADQIVYSQQCTKHCWFGIVKTKRTFTQSIKLSNRYEIKTKVTRDQQSDSWYLYRITHLK